LQFHLRPLLWLELIWSGGLYLDVGQCSSAVPHGARTAPGRHTCDRPAVGGGEPLHLGLGDLVSRGFGRIAHAQTPSARGPRRVIVSSLGSSGPSLRGNARDQIPCHVNLKVRCWPPTWHFRYSRSEDAFGRREALDLVRRSLEHSACLLSPARCEGD